MAYYRMHSGQVSGAADSLLKGTGFEQKKSLFDINRIKRNVKREIYRVLHRRGVLAKKRQDALTLHNELVRCLKALGVLIKGSKLISSERRKDFLDFLLHERQRLLEITGRIGR